MFDVRFWNKSVFQVDFLQSGFAPPCLYPEALLTVSAHEHISLSNLNDVELPGNPMENGNYQI